MNYQNESLTSLKKLEMFALVSGQDKALNIIRYEIKRKENK